MRSHPDNHYQILIMSQALYWYFRHAVSFYLQQQLRVWILLAKSFSVARNVKLN